MRSRIHVAAALLLALGACRSRLPVDRPAEAAPATAPVPPAIQGQVEYYQISEG